MGPTWGRPDPGGPHVGPMNLAISVSDGCKCQVQNMSSLTRHNVIIQTCFSTRPELSYLGLWQSSASIVHKEHSWMYCSTDSCNATVLWQTIGRVYKVHTSAAHLKRCIPEQNKHIKVQLKYDSIPVGLELIYKMDVVICFADYEIICSVRICISFGTGIYQSNEQTQQIRKLPLLLSRSSCRTISRSAGDCRIHASHVTSV